MNYMSTVARGGLIIALCLSLGWRSSESFGAYFQPLGYFIDNTYNSTPDSIANDVSADGLVVVGNSRYVNQIGAFRWTAETGMVGLGDLPGGVFDSRANSISRDGSAIVGFSARGGLSENEAFLWTESGGMVGLGYLPTSTNSFAADVSNGATVVVGTSSRPYSDHQARDATRWTTADGMVPLDAYTASAVSADGSVIVGTSSYDQPRHAFLWTEANGLKLLGELQDPPDSTPFSHAVGVSADGTVVVGEVQVAGGAEAFRWTAAGGMIRLGDLPGGDLFSRGWDVSDDGLTIVGDGWSGLGREAIIWTPSSGIRRIADLLSEIGMDTDGYRLDIATAVSANGMVIVGHGRNSQGYDEGWLVNLDPSAVRPLNIPLPSPSPLAQIPEPPTVPEPSSAVILLGLISSLSTARIWRRSL